MKAADYRATAMTEAALLATVRAMAKRLGWLMYHTHNSKHSEAGFPDIVLARHGIVIFAELKSQTGRITPEQQKWLDELSETQSQSAQIDNTPDDYGTVYYPVQVMLWRPSDLPEIERILR